MIEAILDAIEEVDRSHDFTSQAKSSEKFFTDRLAEALAQHGKCVREVPYSKPYSRKKCDLCITSDVDKLWLEVKLLFPEHWARKKMLWRNQQRLFEPLKSCGSYLETHSVALDLFKLATYGMPEATHVGIIVVASSTKANNCRQDFIEFSKLAELDDPWLHGGREFPNSFWKNDGYLLEANVWLCPWGSVSGWWRNVEPLYRPKTSD